MNWYKQQLRDEITYWAPSSRDSYNKITYVSGEVILGRWEEVRERFMGTRGEELISAAIVHVKQDLLEGGYVFEGVSTQADPKDQDKAYSIRAFEKTKDLAGVVVVRKALL